MRGKTTTVYIAFSTDFWVPFE